MNKIRLLPIRGTAWELGYQHGTVYGDDIRRYTETRLHLVENGEWKHPFPPDRNTILELAEACIPAHEAYAPDLMEETRGMAAATGLSVAELLIVSGFTDFIDVVYNAYPQPLPAPLVIDDCTAFLIPDSRANGKGFFGQTWDMNDSSTEYVVLLRVEGENRPNSLVFTSVGCLGQIGMNEHGIAIGINNLRGSDGQIGVTWPFVVRKVLQQDNIADALACITEAPLAGAHNYLIYSKEGGYNIEAMSTRCHIKELEDIPIIHTNHCLVPHTQEVEQKSDPTLGSTTRERLAQAQTTFAKPSITLEDLQELTRTAPVCTRPRPPRYIATCGAAIMQPKTGAFHAVWGLPSENEYESFTI